MSREFLGRVRLYLGSGMRSSALCCRVRTMVQSDDFKTHKTRCRPSVLGNRRVSCPPMPHVRGIFPENTLVRGNVDVAGRAVMESKSSDSLPSSRSPQQHIRPCFRSKVRYRVRATGGWTASGTRRLAPDATTDHCVNNSNPPRVEWFVACDCGAHFLEFVGNTDRIEQPCRLRGVVCSTMENANPVDSKPSPRLCR